jgi:class 3 adenylate cyclase
MLQLKIKEFFRKGGLKLKFIGFMAFTTLLTVTIVSTSIVVLMKSSIENKALEVATTIIERISESSVRALLERTYENELNLSEMIKSVESSEIEGLVDVSIFARVKQNENFVFEYIAGFGKYAKNEIISNEDSLEKFRNQDTNVVSFYDSTINIDNKEIETYLFVQPINYMFKGEKIYLGVSTLQYDKSAIYGIVKQVIIVAVLITLSILGVTILLLYFAGLHLTKPILSIADAASKVSTGDLDVKLDIHTNDEIEILGNKFNSMVKGLREHSKMQKFVSGLTRDMIHKDDATDLELGGEYKDMTFLFSDIRNFTSMSETKKPAEVVEIINFYLNIQSEIINKYGGDIDKFVGDEIMASFYGENSIQRAIEASIEIQETLKEKNLSRTKKGLSICSVGIGVNHGEVIVGNVGSKDRMDFTSIGTTVNLAARLCSHAKSGEVLITEETMKQSSKKIKSKTIEPIKAKGISKEVEVRSII